MSRPGTPAEAQHASNATSWYAFEAPYQRLRLFSLANIAGIGLAVLLALTIGFPHASLEERLASNEKHRQADRLTAEYLKVFLEAEPQAHGLRVQLVRQLIQLGAFDEARAATRPLHAASAPEWTREAAWLELDMLEQEVFAAAPGSIERAALRSKMNQHLQRLLAQPQDPQRLQQLLDRALASDDTALAVDALRALAGSEERLDADSLSTAAGAALGLQEYRIAADLYFSAMEASPRFDDQRTYFLQALRTLQSGGRYADAIVAADRHLQRFRHDRDTLMFLTRLARAANMPDVAERYVILLLKLSLQQHAQPPVFMHAAWQGTQPRLIRVASLPGDPTLPFDEEAYLLAFTVFLSNQNVEDARRVAASAVRQRPADPAWRKRLAEVSEWSQAPEAALQHWMEYARMTGDKAAWAHTLRLAEGLHDAEATILALQQKLRHEPANVSLLTRLLAAHETAGEPEKSLQLLRERTKGKALPAPQRRRELVLLAELAERVGHDEEALDAWQRIRRDYGTDAEVALHIAQLAGRNGARQEGIWRVLLEAAPQAAPDAAPFWRALAELAWQRQEDAHAMQAYRKLAATDGIDEKDLFNLVVLLENEQPLAASRAAMYGFHKTGSPRFVLMALYNGARASDHQNLLAFLQDLDKSTLATLERDPAFLAGRANLLQLTQDLAGAERDLRAALVLQPGDGQYRASLLWLLIARRDTAALKRALAQWATDAERDAALWGPYAAAHMALNRQRDALHWFRKPGFQRDDYLWMMSYAEALEANAQPDLAWQLRRHAWLNLRKPEVLAQTDPDTLTALRDRLVSLAPLFADGDRASHLLRALMQADMRSLREPTPLRVPSNGRELLAEIESAAAAGPAPQADPANLFAAPGDGGTRDDRRLSATVRELALAYALNRQEHDLAGVWLATRFAQQLSRPLWGELSLLLAADDRPALNRLLDELPDWLPMYDRIEAAQRAGRPALAQTLAFEQFEHLPHDEELHVRFAALATERMPTVHATAGTLRQSPLHANQQEYAVAVPLSNRMWFALELNQSTQKSRDHAQLTNVPAHDRSVGLALRMDIEGGSIVARVHRRSATRTFTGMQLAYSTNVADVDLGAELDWKLPASETALLRVGAVRSGVSTTAGWSIGRTEFLRFGLGWHRFETQAGTPLGTGTTWSAEAGTHLRMEYPNLTLRASISGGRYAPNGRYDHALLHLLPAGTDAQSYPFLPQDSTLYGLALGIGTVVDGRYTRAWRPFADLGLTYGRESGVGVNWSGGIAGSIFGADTLQIKLLRNAGTTTSPEGFTEFGLNYFWLY